MRKNPQNNHDVEIYVLTNSAMGMYDYRGDLVWLVMLATDLAD
jgi:hypothetical protein